MSHGTRLFLEAPADFEASVEVALALCEVEDEILLLHRVPTSRSPALWGIPGGKLDPGESAVEAAVRELHEETGIRTQAEDYLFSGSFFVRAPHVDFVCHTFRVQLARKPAEIELHETEHTDHCWVTPQTALNMPIMGSEPDLLELVYKGNGVG